MNQININSYQDFGFEDLKNLTQEEKLNLAKAIKRYIKEYEEKLNA